MTEELGRAVVLPEPEGHEAGVDEGLSAQARRRHRALQDTVEPVSAFLEPLLRDPEPIQRVRDAERVIGPLVVDEPLDRRDQVVVFVLELLDGRLRFGTPRAGAGFLGETLEGIPRPEHPYDRMVGPRTLRYQRLMRRQRRRGSSVALHGPRLDEQELGARVARAHVDRRLGDDLCRAALVELAGV